MTAEEKMDTRTLLERPPSDTAYNTVGGVAQDKGMGNCIIL